jgi:hypothetical protein
LLWRRYHLWDGRFRRLRNGLQGDDRRSRIGGGFQSHVLQPLLVVAPSAATASRGPGTSSAQRVLALEIMRGQRVENQKDD